MSDINKYIRNNKQVLFLLSGIGIAQAIPLLFSPVLSRLYTPANYAVLAVVLSVANIFFEIISLRYDRAIVIADSEKSAKNLLIACLLFSFFISIVLSPVIYFIYSRFLNGSIEGNFASTFFSTNLILLFMGIVMAAGYWFQRIKAHKIIVTNKIVQMSFITAVSILFGVYSIDNGLIKGYLFGWGILFLFTFYQLKQTGFLIFKDYDLKELKLSLKKNISFPKYNMLPALLHAIAMSLPVFMIIKLYGNHEGGNFNMCRQLLLLPAGFISSAFIQVYYRRLSEVKEQNLSIFPVLKQMLYPVIYIGIPVTILVSFFAPSLFSFVLGENWLLAGHFARVYVFAVLLQFLSLCLSVVFPVLQLIKQESLFKTLYFLSICMLFIFKLDNAQAFMIYYSIIEIFIFGLMAAFCLYKAYRHLPSN